MTAEDKREFFKRNDALVISKLTELLKRKPLIHDFKRVEVVVKKSREVIIKYKGKVI